MSDTEKIAKLETEVGELRRMVLSMQNYNTITPSFKKVIERANLGSSSKTSSSENQVVNEGGSDTYSVLKAPDGFDEATINGAVHYYPYYT